MDRVKYVPEVFVVARGRVRSRMAITELVVDAWKKPVRGGGRRGPSRHSDASSGQNVGVSSGSKGITRGIDRPHPAFVCRGRVRQFRVSSSSSAALVVEFQRLEQVGGKVKEDNPQRKVWLA